MIIRNDKRPNRDLRIRTTPDKLNAMRDPNTPNASKQRPLKLNHPANQP